MKFNLTLMLCLLGFITGCGQKVKTVQYYAAHSDEAKSVIVKCQTLDQTDKDIALNCQNAYSAEVAKGFSGHSGL